jgi:hypothetical protein
MSANDTCCEEKQLYRESLWKKKYLNRVLNKMGVNCSYMLAKVKKENLYNHCVATCAFDTEWQGETGL